MTKRNSTSVSRRHFAQASFATGAALRLSTARNALSQEGKSSPARPATTKNVVSWMTGAVLQQNKIVSALEVLIMPGDRVVIEGDNQKQADFLSRSLSKADPRKLHDIHMIQSSVSRPEHHSLGGSLDTWKRGYKLNPTMLTAMLLISAVCGLSQQAETQVNARHVIGLENVKRNRAGKLTVQNGVMQFAAGTTDAKVPTAAIDDLSIGSETTQAGGKGGTVVKTAAIAAPYDSGAALSLLLRTKADILTVSYRDSGGGLHAAILALPRRQAEQERAKLIAAGAQASASAGQELKERKAGVPPTQKADVQKLSASAIQIEPVEAGDVRIPAEFRSAIYEFLVERVREAGTFRQVFRSGDRAAGSIPSLVTLHTTVEKFKEGSQMKREVTSVLGATTVDVSASVTARDGRTLLDSRIHGKVRFFGENLGVTNDLAKRVAKLLRKNFGTKSGDGSLATAFN